MPVDPKNPLDLLAFAAQNYPGQFALLPVSNPADPAHQLLVRARVQSKPIPPAMKEHFVSANGGEPPTHFDTGRLLTIIPSDVARGLAGPESERDVVWLLVIRRQVYERAASGILTPRIIAP